MGLRVCEIYRQFLLHQTLTASQKFPAIFSLFGVSCEALRRPDLWVFLMIAFLTTPPPSSNLIFAEQPVEPSNWWASMMTSFDFDLDALQFVPPSGSFPPSQNSQKIARFWICPSTEKLMALSSFLLTDEPNLVKHIFRMLIDCVLSSFYVIGLLSS